MYRDDGKNKYFDPVLFFVFCLSLTAFCFYFLHLKTDVDFYTPYFVKMGLRKVDNLTDISWCL